MSNLSLRGVDAATLARIKSDARRRKVSVNRLIVETLQQQFRAGGAAYDDLNALAGKWSAAQAAAFDAAVAPFGEVDTAMWVAEPVATYRVTPIVKRGAAAAKAKKRAGAVVAAGRK